jgi:TPR repeat protein
MRVSFSSIAGFLVCAVFVAGCATPTHEEIQSSFNAGLKAYDAGDYRSAYKTWGDIEDHDLAAMRNVALMLRKGQGVEKDTKTALRKMLRAADLGLVTAQADAGEMIAQGEAGPPDKAAAVPWLSRAANAGHPIAALELARILETGDGVPADPKEACRLYTLAASFGLPEAVSRVKALGDTCPLPVPPATQGPLPPTPSAH